MQMKLSTKISVERIFAQYRTMTSYLSTILCNTIISTGRLVVNLGVFTWLFLHIVISKFFNASQTLSDWLHGNADETQY